MHHYNICVCANVSSRSDCNRKHDTSFSYSRLSSFAELREEFQFRRPKNYSRRRRTLRLYCGLMVTLSVALRCQVAPSEPSVIRT